MRSKSCPEKGLVRRETRGGKCIHAELVRRGLFPERTRPFIAFCVTPLSVAFGIVRETGFAPHILSGNAACRARTHERTRPVSGQRWKSSGPPRVPCLERVAFEFETFMMTK